MTLEERAAKIIDTVLSLLKEGYLPENMIGAVIFEIRETIKESKGSTGL